MVASKSREEMTQFQESIDKSITESKIAAQTCTSIKFEITNFVNSTKIDLDTIISKGTNNIKQFENSHNMALA